APDLHCHINVLFYRTKNLLTSSNVLVLNLAISDMVITMQSPIVVVNSFWNGPVLGDI
ncbi:hypothetical protein QYM36_004677, partial [Artemia franciscana]